MDMRKSKGVRPGLWHAIAFATLIAACILPGGASALSSEFADTAAESHLVQECVIAHTNDPTVLSGEPIISELDGTYLIAYGSEEEAKQAAARLSLTCDFAETDGPVGAAAEQTGDGIEAYPNGADPFTLAENTDGVLDSESLAPPPDSDDESAPSETEEDASSERVRTVAVIDSGAPAGGAEQSVSVIGDETGDESGHATAVIADILSFAPDARIASIRILDADNRGTVAAAYAGIKTAISLSPDIINLSIIAPLTQESAAINAAVSEARSAGIVVVAAAGNESDDAAVYAPASSPDAITVGSCDDSGIPRAESNYGACVDCLAFASSTSSAAAKTSGWLAAWSALSSPLEDIAAHYGEGLFFPPGEDPEIGTQWNRSPVDGEDAVGNQDGGSSGQGANADDAAIDSADSGQAESSDSAREDPVAESSKTIGEDSPENARKPVKAAATNISALETGISMDVKKTELRSVLGWGGHHADRSSSAVPKSEIRIANGGWLPLAEAELTSSGFTKKPVKTTYNRCDSQGPIPRYGVWIPFDADYVTGKNKRIKGTLTLKWSNIATDKQGNSLDFTLTASEIYVKTNHSAAKKSKHLLLFNNNSSYGATGKGGYLVISSRLRDVDGTNLRIGVSAKLTGRFYRAGTKTVSDSCYLFRASDIDQPDKTLYAPSAMKYGPENEYVESLKLISGFAPHAYLQRDIPKSESNGSDKWTNPAVTESGIENRSYGKTTLVGADVKEGIIRASKDSPSANLYPLYYRTGFAALTSAGSSQVFRWSGSLCGTVLYADYEGVKIRDRNSKARTTGANRTDRAVIQKTVNAYGQMLQSNSEKAATARTNTSYRKTEMPWKGAATYTFSALPGYRVSKVSLRAYEGNTEKGSWSWSSGAHLKSLAFDEKGAFKTTNDYDIVVTTARVDDAKATVKAKKILSGRTLASGQFTFGLYESSSAKAKPIATAVNDAAGNVSFSGSMIDALSWTYSDSEPLPISKTLYIREIASNQRGIVHDDACYRADIRISWDSAFKPTVTIGYVNTATNASTSTPTFNNAYEPRGGALFSKIDADSGAGLPGAVFRVYEGSYDTVDALADKKAAAEAVTGNDGIASLPDSTLKADGTTYTVIEAEAPQGYYLVDPEDDDGVAYLRTFRLTTDGQVADLTDDPAENRMKPGAAVITATKQLDGRLALPGEFRFILEPLDADAPMPADATAENDADGIVRFGEIELNPTDIGQTFRYRVSEVTGDDRRIDYDESSATVEVRPLMGESGVVAHVSYTPEMPVQVSGPSPDNDALDSALGRLQRADSHDTASSLLVAIVDTGCPDAPAVVNRLSLIGGNPDDENGHGTMMLDAILDECPDARVLSIKALDEDGRANVRTIAHAIRVAAHAGADIINLSFAARGYSAEIEHAVMYARAQGCTAVAAAGNEGDDCHKYCPANIAGVCAVGATDAFGNPLSMSNENADAWVFASSTSEAAARMSGGLAASMGSRAPGLNETPQTPCVDIPNLDASTNLAFTAQYSKTVKGPNTKPVTKNGNAISYQSALDYTITTTATQVKLEWQARLISSGTPRSKGTLSGTGQTTVTFSEKTPASSGAGITFGSGTWTWARGTSNSTKTVKLSLGPTAMKTSYADGTSTATLSVSVPALETYSVTYNANGGTGAPSAQTKTYGKTLKLSTTRPTRTNYIFKEWNTKSDGSGTAYAPGANYTGNAALKLYAQWYPPHTVSYNANGGSGAPASQTKVHGVTLTLSSAKPTRTGYTFLKWTTAANGTGTSYNPGGSYTADAALTLYAQWKPNMYTVSYNANGGTGTMQASSHSYGTAKALTRNAFTRAGYLFMGWSRSKTGAVTYSDGQSVLNLSSTADATVVLYAIWEEANLANWAVYSEDDRSLTFLYSEGQPTTDSFGKTVTASWLGENSWRTADYASASNVPWHAYRNEVTSITFSAKTQPASTSHWFEDMDALSSIGGSARLDLSHAASTANMFSGCSSLKQLDVSRWEVSTVTNMASMFSGCSALTSIYAGDSTDWSGAANGAAMFEGTTELVGGAGTVWDAAYQDASRACVDGLNGKSGYFTALARESVTGEAVFTNVFTPHVGASFSKEDAETNMPLAQAVFEISGNEEGARIFVDGVETSGTLRIETDGDGFAHTGGDALVSGKRYKVREVKAPDGYAIDDGEWHPFIAGQIDEDDYADDGEEVFAGTWLDSPLACAFTISVEKRFVRACAANQSLPARIGGGQFEFELHRDAPDGPLVESISTKGSEDGIERLSFTPLAFDANDIGEHIYYVVECEGADDNVAYDTEPQPVSITVSAVDDEADGIETTHLEAKSNGRDEAVTSFQNTYQPSFVAMAYKHGNNASGADVPLAGATFALFELPELGTGPSPAIPSALTDIEQFENAFTLDQYANSYSYDADSLEKAGLIYVATATSGIDGYARTSEGDLRSGKAYALIEVKAPDGYYLNDRRAPDGTNPTVFVIDDFAPDGSFSHESYPSSSDADTLEYVNLDSLGTQVHETTYAGAVTEAFTGYRIVIGSHETAEADARFSFENSRRDEQLGGLGVMKVSSEDGEPLAGATFQVYPEPAFTDAWRAWHDKGNQGGDEAFFASLDGESEDAGQLKPMEITLEPTDEYGFSFTNDSALEPGSYRVVESDPPGGYDRPAYDFSDTSGAAGNVVIDVSAGEVTFAEFPVSDPPLQPIEGDAPLTIRKILHGGSLASGAFSFELYSSNDTSFENPLSVASNEADGTVQLGRASWTSAQGGVFTLEDAQGNAVETITGEDASLPHRYLIREAIPDEARCATDSEDIYYSDFVRDAGNDAAQNHTWVYDGVSYDSEALEVQVEVFQEDGSVAVSVSYPDGDVFENTCGEGAGGVIVMKADDEGHPLAGASFTLKGTTDEGREFSKTITSDEEGIAQTGPDEIPLGSYEIREVSAPEGYRVNGDWGQTFEITTFGQVIDFSVNHGSWCIDELDEGLALPITGAGGITLIVASSIASILVGILLFRSSSGRSVAARRIRCLGQPWNGMGNPPFPRRHRVASMTRISLIPCIALCICAALSVPAPAIGDSADGVNVESPSAHAIPALYPYYRTNPTYFEGKDWESAPHQEDRTTANADGSLSQWQPGWYVAHRDTGYGNVIARLAKGDTVRIDGSSFAISGKTVAEHGMKPSEVRSLAGDPDAILETCETGTSRTGRQLICFVWGDKIAP